MNNNNNVAVAFGSAANKTSLAGYHRRNRSNNKLVYPCRVEGWLNVYDRDLQIGHRPANVVKDKKFNFVIWEPYFCVLLQDEQTLTAYRSEELSIFPGTALRTITHAFKLNKRWQRSIGQTAFFSGHHFINPIEPSNDLFEHGHVPDSRIDAYIPPYWPFSKSSPVVQDVFPIQNSNTYRPKNPLYAVPIFEPDFGSLQQQDHAVPHRLSPEDNYKSYLSSPLSNAYRQPSNKEPNVAIQLLGTTNIFHGFGISPTYQTVSDIRREEDSPISQNVAESIPNMFKESPTVIIVAVSPKELHSAQESTYREPVLMQQNEGPVMVVSETTNGERSPEMTTSVKEILDPELNELNSTKVSMEETVASGEQDEPENRMEDSIVLEEETSTVEYESTSSTTMMTVDSIIDELSPLIDELDPLIDELNSTTTEDDSNALPTEEESHVETTEVIPTEYAASSVTEKLIWPEYFNKMHQMESNRVRLLFNELKQQEDLRQKLMTTVDNISAEFPLDLAIDQIAIAHHSLEPLSPISDDDNDDDDELTR